MKRWVLASDLAGKAPGGFSVAAVALARAGRTDEARAALNRLVELAQHRYVPAYDIALVHAALVTRTRLSSGWIEP